jgi:hypothetical protein
MLLGIVAGVMAVVALGFAGFTLLSPPPAATSAALTMPAATSLDQRWGTYLGEREWGTPREAVGSNGWGLSWKGAITTPYKYGDDGICGWSDETDQFRMSWAFWDRTQDHVTERFNGLSNMAGPAGEQITDDRVYHENSLTHAYDRLTYRYPMPDKWFSIDCESARYDSTSMTFAVTVTNTTSDTRSLDVVFKGWTGDASEVEPLTNGLLMRGATSYVAIVGRAPSEWQIDGDKGALDANLRTDAGLNGDQGGDIGALAYNQQIPAGAQSVIHLGAAEVGFDDVTGEDAAKAEAATTATDRLRQSDAIIAARRTEADGNFVGDVTQHAALYQQALNSVLWNETYYRWDGTSGVNPAYAGQVDAHDLLILPDKWEFPWAASWDSAFESVTASLIDPTLAQDQLKFILSDRWEQADGHIPCNEWVMDQECPPIFAWAAWRVYEQNHDLSFLQSVYPALQRNYDYWWSHNSVGGSLFTGGFLGMDNLPRGGPGQAQADASGWMAMFARDMARIASEVRDPAGSQRYWVDRGNIQQAINSELWDDQTGFYYDLNSDGSFVIQKSYSGLVPMIAGVVPPERVPRILAALHDPNEFLGPGGIRSLSADSTLYTPGLAGAGINSNWRGPVWVPINYLLIESLTDIDPGLAEDLRDRVVDNVEADWRATGRIHEFFDGDTGKGLGADEQAGWTALVANLIRDAWPATAPSQ